MLRPDILVRFVVLAVALFAVAANKKKNRVDYPTVKRCQAPERNGRPNKLNLLIDAKGWRHHLTKENTVDLDIFFNVYFGEALKMMPCALSFWTQFDLIVSFHSHGYTYLLSLGDKFVHSPSFALSPKELDFGKVRTMERKAEWRQWMLGNGFETLVAKPISQTQPTFPCVVKTNANRETVKANDIIVGKVQLKHFLDKHGLTNFTSEYTLEEPLQGMSSGRALAFGSALTGNVLSLRCAVEKISNFTMKSSGQVLSHEDRDAWKYVNELGDESVLAVGTRSYTPCGRLMVTNVHKVMNFAKYSGPFCIDYRRDKEGKMIMLDISPRICVAMMKHPELLVSTLLPLAYTIRTQELPKLSPPDYMPPPPLPHDLGEDMKMITGMEHLLALGRNCGDIIQANQQGFKGKVNYIYSFYCDGKNKPASTVGGSAVVPFIQSPAYTVDEETMAKILKATKLSLSKTRTVDNETGETVESDNVTVELPLMSKKAAEAVKQFLRKYQQQQQQKKQQQQQQQQQQQSSNNNSNSDNMLQNRQYSQ